MIIIKRWYRRGEEKERKTTSSSSSSSHNTTATKITKIVEIINLSFLKIKFKNQSKHKIRKYTLDLNSRKIYFENKNLNLTEKESDLILFINSLKRADLKKIQKTVWGYSNDLETHTVETHIYRLRKKMIKTFEDHNFIKHDQDGYFIN